MAQILLVDDDESFRKMLREMLERAGHEVRDARNGKIALELDLQEPSDLVVLDLVMPEKEGLETILELRRRHVGVKIIAMSGGDRNHPNVHLDLTQPEGSSTDPTRSLSRNDILRAISGGGRTNPSTNLAMAQKFGARRALMKPFSRNEILGAIDQVLAE